jgi:hypothetical protein
VRFSKPTTMLSNAIICQDCEYEVTPSSPRYAGPRFDVETFLLVKFKPWNELDEDTRLVLDSAHQTALEVAKWPSWKLGRCNCPDPACDAFERSG